MAIENQINGVIRDTNFSLVALSSAKRSSLYLLDFFEKALE